MKIAFVAPASSIHTARWVNSLSENNIDITLFSLRCHRDIDGAISDKVKITYLAGKNSLAYFTSSNELRKHLDNEDFDLVNTHYASGYGTLARLAKARPMLLNVWGSDVYDFPYQSGIKHKLLTDNLKYADKLASTSYSMGEQTKKLLGNEDIEIAITPFGVDIKKFMRAGDISKNSDEINLGIIKTLSPKYGIEYLIKAFSILLSLYNGDKKLKLKIYGSGDLLEQLIDLTKELKIDRDVTFMGKIPNDEVPSALWGIDIFCLSSILDSESFGVSAVEAMAAGLPVVATDVSGFKEVMEDGTTGIIVPAKDPQAMAHAILRLIEDRQLRDLMGASGQERVTELYNWDNNVQNMIDLYNDLIK